MFFGALDFTGFGCYGKSMTDGYMMMMMSGLFMMISSIKLLTGTHYEALVMEIKNSWGVALVG